MKYIFTILAFIPGIVSLAQPAPIPFKKLSGTWVMAGKQGSKMVETWHKKGKNGMYGKSYMVKGHDTTTLETVDWETEGGNMFYIPVTSGQNDEKPVRFKLTSYNGNVYIFENPAHDFPKRIVYDFVSSDKLHAYIDDGTENNRQHYHYKKQP